MGSKLYEPIFILNNDIREYTIHCSYMFSDDENWLICSFTVKIFIIFHIINIF